jgi:hypothetical protein
MSSHAVNTFGSDVSAFFKSAGIWCTTPLEVFFCDIDELSFRTLQRRENLRKGCGAFGYDEFLTLRLTRRSRPVWIWQLRGFGQHRKSGSGPIGFIHNAPTVSAAKRRETTEGTAGLYSEDTSIVVSGSLARKHSKKPDYCCWQTVDANFDRRVRR